MKVNHEKAVNKYNNKIKNMEKITEPHKMKRKKKNHLRDYNI